MAGTDKTQVSITGGPSVILVEPQLGENIGLAARAMMNGGLSDLRIVKPRDGWPNPKANAAASGAELIIEAARIYGSTEEAVVDLQRVFAMTARPREMIKPVAKPRDAASEMRALIRDKLRIGILFGPERKGLDNDEVALADTVVQAPLNPAHSSMNLGHAVMVMSYEWFQSDDDTPDRFLNEGRTGLASKEELFIFFGRLEAELDACGFFHVAEKRPIMVRNIRNIFQRSELTEQEVRILHGIVSGLIRLSHSKDESEPRI
ncbi:MAG: RNA methyltransferase [Pseudomonadota bacterium]|nr:RNA methyltransferase [Pseudomonadota bacterium]